MKQMIKKLAVVLSVALVCAPMGAMAANKLIVKKADGVTDALVVTDTGWLGMGVSAPFYPIHIQQAGNANVTKLYFNNTGNPAGYTIWDSPALIFMRNNNATTGPNGTLPTAGDRLGSFSFGSVINGVDRTLGNVQVFAKSAATASSAPTYMTFDTTNTGALNASERMRINEVGSVGIGTIAPRQKLEINGGVRLLTTATKPLCDLANSWQSSGTFWFTTGATGVKDSLEVCAKDAGGNFAWRTIY
ncbi:MAG: hypothetical protein GJV46_07170 [Geobacter sp.]|nr:hypothetical protein [Geobacter sp.]